jgi:small subunit ribosomal protein S1
MATKKKDTSKAKTKVKSKVISKVSDTSKLSLMDRLLAGSKVTPVALKRGQEIEGVITSLGRRLLLLDIGAKTEGMVTGDDASDASDLLSELKVGDKIKAFVKYPENDQGQIILSLKKAAEAGRWDRYAKLLTEEKETDVVGLEVNRGGMVVKCGEMRGFVPTSQFGEKHLGKMEDLLNKKFKVRVIEVDREQNRLIFSEKQVSDSEALSKRHEALEEVKEGGELVGTVSGIMPFGVFVTVSIPMNDKKKKDEKEAKVEGLIHISEISWEKVEDPNTMFKVGQEVKVEIIGIEKKAGKLNLSIKRLSKDPWDEIEKSYAVGTKHKGKVIRSAPYGIFVNFEPGIDGLIHVTNKPADREFEVDEEVEVFVEKIDGKNRRMSLGVVLTKVPVGYR